MNEGIARGLVDQHVRIELPVELKRAEYEMAPEVIAALDPFDVEAIEAAGDNARHYVEQLLVLSTNRFAVVAGGKVLALVGTFVPIRYRVLAEAGMRTPQGQLFLFVTTHVGLAPKQTRQAVKHIAVELLKFYDELFGYIDVRHARLLAFAQWLGGELAEPAPFGPNGSLFRRFTFRS